MRSCAEINMFYKIKLLSQEIISFNILLYSKKNLGSITYALKKSFVRKTHIYLLKFLFTFYLISFKCFFFKNFDKNIHQRILVLYLKLGAKI